MRPAGPSWAAWTTAPKCTAPKACARQTCCRAIRSPPIAAPVTNTPWKKAGATQGWTFTIYAEEWNCDFWGEFDHFVDYVQNDKEPVVTGRDARTVMEVLFAAYESAREGRKVTLPFRSDAAKPWDLWGKS